MKLAEILKQKINESGDLKVSPELIFEIYDILSKEYPDIEKDYTKSAFYFFINNNLKKYYNRK